jgi:hypothetical protein
MQEQLDFVIFLILQREHGDMEYLSLMYQDTDYNTHQFYRGEIIQYLIIKKVMLTEIG